MTSIPAWKPNGVFYPITAPPSISGGTWTYLNQAGFTATDSSTGIEISNNTNNAGYISGIMRSLPATPYDIRMGIISTIYPGNFSAVGMFLYDTVSGKGQWFVDGYNNASNSPGYITWIGN